MGSHAEHFGRLAGYDASVTLAPGYGDEDVERVRGVLADAGMASVAVRRTYMTARVDGQARLVSFTIVGGGDTGRLLPGLDGLPREGVLVSSGLARDARVTELDGSVKDGAGIWLTDALGAVRRMSVGGTYERLLVGGGVVMSEPASELAGLGRVSDGSVCLFVDSSDDVEAAESLVANAGVEVVSSRSETLWAYRAFKQFARAMVVVVATYGGAAMALLFCVTWLSCSSAVRERRRGLLVLMALGVESSVARRRVLRDLWPLGLLGACVGVAVGIAIGLWSVSFVEPACSSFSHAPDPVWVACGALACVVVFALSSLALTRGVLRMRASDVTRV
jgi:hypothetical protein